MIEYPTGDVMYLEAGGKKIAVVQCYTAKPDANGRHYITMYKVHAANEAIRNGLAFYTLDDFNLVICKPNRKVIYSGCRWIGIEETGTLGAMTVEWISAVAERRKEDPYD